KDITLRGLNFETQNVLSEEHEKVETGAYVPYGTKTSNGQIIKGRIPCTGAVMRVPLSGGYPELVAWGFRNPYGLAFLNDGRIYVSDNGYDKRASRPVFSEGDLLWKVKDLPNQKPGGSPVDRNHCRLHKVYHHLKKQVQKSLTTKTK